MAGRVTDKDLGEKALLARLADAAKGVTLTVGVHEEQGAEPAESGGGITVGEVATINEYGLGVPERSFIRAWADENADTHQDFLRRAGVEIVKGRLTATQALDQVGLKMVGEVQTRMAGGIPPPNAPSTIAKKGSSTPLEDTGQLRSSITHKVE